MTFGHERSVGWLMCFAESVRAAIEAEHTAPITKLQDDAHPVNGQHAAPRDYSRDSSNRSQSVHVKCYAWTLYVLLDQHRAPVPATSRAARTVGARAE